MARSSLSGCMSSGAWRSRSQGLTAAHPEVTKAHATAANTNIIRCNSIELLLQQFQNRLLALRFHGFTKSAVALSHHAFAVEQKTHGHRSNAELRSQRTPRIELDAKSRGHGSKKFLGQLAILIEIDSNHQQIGAGIAALHLIHPGKRSPARIAPGPPEIEQHDFALKAVK